MTILEELCSYGVVPTLGGKGKLVVSGLASLTDEQVVKVEALARTNKAALVAELQEKEKKQRHRRHPAQDSPRLPLTPSECHEVGMWPVEVQREFVRVRDVYTNEGYQREQAGGMAYEVVRLEVSTRREQTEPWCCQCCGGETYFVNLGNQRVCATCHPPVDPVRFPVVSERSPPLSAS